MRRYLFAALAATALATLFVVGASANLAGSTFESNDANLVVNGGAGAHDWDNAPNLSVGQDLPTGTTDNSFGQGAKENDVNTNVVTGSIPNSKADLARFAVSNENIGGSEYLYLAWSRENQSGTVNFDFEINAAAQPDLTTAGAKVLNRTVNDLLINYAFQGGSNSPTLTKFTWNGSDWGTGSVISSACSEGLTNSSPVSENLGGLTAVNRPAQQFGEAGINLACAGVIPQGSCKSFSSAYVKSRSSTSFTSEIKDFIAPVQVKGNNCGKLTIIKHTNPRGLDQAFSYTPSANLSASKFSLNDAGNSAGGDSAANTKVFDSLQPGTYTVSEDADPTGFKFNNVSCTGAGGSSSGRVATAVIVGGSDITCTYTNDQQLGAIKVLKKSVKGQALAGATFSIAGQSVQTGADGTACVDGLTFGSYDVKETAAPAGYSISDPTTHSVTVNVNQKCADITAANALLFNDTPLTDITVEAKSQASGGTQSTISCVDSSNGAVGTGGAKAEDSKLSATGVSPDTYTCTVVVDP